MFAQDRWFSTCTIATKTGCHDITEKLLTVAALFKQTRLQWEHGERQ